MNDKKQNRYVGIHNDMNGGMTDTGKIIRDAWAFGIIDENETCEGWLLAGIEDLWGKVHAEWEKHGFLVNNLPEDVREKYMKIQTKAVASAKTAGWDPDISDEG